MAQRSSRTIIVPIVFAVLCAGGLAWLLSWQVSTTHKDLQARISELSINAALPEGELQIPIVEQGGVVHAMRKGDVLSLQGKWKEAEQEYALAVQQQGGLPALRKLAIAQLQRRNFEQAQQTINQLEAAGARPEDILLLKSIVALRTGRLTQAREILEQSADSPQKSYALALLAIMEGNHPQAIQALKQVEAGWEPTLRSYARILLNAYDEFSLFPKSPNIHLVALLSRALAEVQECELSLPLLSQVTQTKQDYRDAWIVQGYCELVTERYNEALSSLEKAYAIAPQKAETQYLLGRTFTELGNHESAITFFEYALKNGFEPKEDIYRAIAQEAIVIGNTEKVLEQYAALIALPQPTIKTYEEFVAVAQALNAHDEAYETAKTAAQQFTDNAAAWELFAQAAIASDKAEEAKQALQQALLLEPARRSAQVLLNSIQ